MNNQWRVVLRIGNEFVADRRLWVKEEAQKEQQRILASPTYRTQDTGTVGCRVMHHNTFQAQMREKDNFTTLQRIEDNIRRYGSGMLKISPLAKQVTELSDLFKVA